MDTDRERDCGEQKETGSPERQEGTALGGHAHRSIGNAPAANKGAIRARYAVVVGPRTALSLVTVAAAALLAANALAVAAVPGNPVRGKAYFVHTGLFCTSCHTLKATRSTGRDGPNLNKAKPGYARIVERVTQGRNPTRRWPTGMPAYGGRHAELTKAQIQDIAAFVYSATHK